MEEGKEGGGTEGGRDILENCNLEVSMGCQQKGHPWIAPNMDNQKLLHITNCRHHLYWNFISYTRQSILFVPCDGSAC